MKRAVVLKHAPFEGPARIADLLHSRGYALETRELYRGDPVPERPMDGVVLVVMGGPMGVSDVGGKEFPFLQPEVALLKACVAEDAPVLGVCLGAQLLAFAAGASVAQMKGSDGQRLYEVGWAPVRFQFQEAHDPVLSGLPESSQVLHWHGDAFETPVGARKLASTDTCPNQAFQLGSRLFGLQFHCEVTSPDVETFLLNDAAFVVQANGKDGETRIRRDTRALAPAFRNIGDRLLENMFDVMERPR